MLRVGPGGALRPSPTRRSGHRCHRRTLRSPALLGLPHAPLRFPPFSPCHEGVPGFQQPPRWAPGHVCLLLSPVPAPTAGPRFSETRLRRQELRAGGSAFRVARGRRLPGPLDPQVENTGRSTAGDPQSGPLPAEGLTLPSVPACPQDCGLPGARRPPALLCGTVWKGPLQLKHGKPDLSSPFPSEVTRGSVGLPRGVRSPYMVHACRLPLVLFS